MTSTAFVNQLLANFLETFILFSKLVVFLTDVDHNHRTFLNVWEFLHFGAFLSTKNTFLRILKFWRTRVGGGQMISEESTDFHMSGGYPVQNRRAGGGSSGSPGAADPMTACSSSSRSGMGPRRARGCFAAAIWAGSFDWAGNKKSSRSRSNESFSTFFLVFSK